MNKLALVLLAVIASFAVADVRAGTPVNLGPPIQQAGPLLVPETGGTLFLLASSFMAIAALRYKLAR
ncbi:MAG: hypothetical protein QOH39_2898 [Verrucomicrobiota bacterium]|jgi:hypothetical protein